MRNFLLPLLSVCSAVGLAWAVGHGLPLEVAIAIATAVPGGDAVVRALRKRDSQADDLRHVQDVYHLLLGAGWQPPQPQITVPPLSTVTLQPLPPADETKPGVRIPSGLRQGPCIALLVLCLAATGCGTTWGAALGRCGLAAAPQAATTGVSLALHQAEGWEAALASLVGTYGRCVVDALVRSHADGVGEPPPSRATSALTTSPGELGAQPVTQPPAVVRRRALDWLGR